MTTPRLPLELFSEISLHLPKEDVLNLALTNKSVHDITIGCIYRHIEIGALDGNILMHDLQKSSVRCMRALMDDQRKRQGVESMRFHGIGTIELNNLHGDDTTIPEPFKTSMDIWLSAQPLLIQLVHILLTGDFEFPKLRTIMYDARALSTEQDTTRFLAFIRRHPAIRNVISEEDHAGLFDKWAFSQLPDDLVCRLANLERAITYGPLLPLLLGFSLSPSGSSGEFGPLTRSDTMPDTLPLKRVHILWPQRCIRIVQAKNEDCPTLVSVNLDILNVIKALGSVCGSSLESLFVGVDDDRIDQDLFAMISFHFPKLRELYIGPASSDPMARFPNQYFLRRVASTLSPLKHLIHFEYCNVSVHSEQYHQHADVLELGEDWGDTSRTFLRCCPSLRYLKLYSLAWRRSVVTVEKMPVEAIFDV